MMVGTWENRRLEAGEERYRKWESRALEAGGSGSPLPPVPSTLLVPFNLQEMFSCKSIITAYASMSTLRSIIDCCIFWLLDQTS